MNRPERAWDEAAISHNNIVSPRIHRIAVRLNNWILLDDDLCYITDLNKTCACYAVLCVCEFLCAVYGHSMTTLSNELRVDNQGLVDLGFL